VVSVCRALAEAGATTLRFNFRGAGRSEGEFDSGRGEASDARAAVDALRALRPHGRLLLAGYSFGAMIAAGIADAVRPDALVLVSPPAGMATLSPIDASTPALLITGEHDQVAPPDAVRAYAGAGREIVVVTGADHGWWPGIGELTAALSAFIESTQKIFPA
jgi:alpha/beta superfamily hydrolase